MCVCVCVPGWYRDLSEAPQCRGLSQTHKGDERLVKKVHFTNQDIGSLGITRDLLHELVLQLKQKEKLLYSHLIQFHLVSPHFKIFGIKF